MKLTRTSTTLARQAGTLAVSLALGTPFITGPMNATAAEGQTSVAQAAQENTNGAAGQMPAYYDGALFTVNMIVETDEVNRCSVVGGIRLR